MSSSRPAPSPPANCLPGSSSRQPLGLIQLWPRDSRRFLRFKSAVSSGKRQLAARCFTINCENLLEHKSDSPWFQFTWALGCKPPVPFGCRVLAAGGLLLAGGPWSAFWGPLSPVCLRPGLMSAWGPGDRLRASWAVSAVSTGPVGFHAFVGWRRRALCPSPLLALCIKKGDNPDAPAAVGLSLSAALGLVFGCKLTTAQGGCWLAAPGGEAVGLRHGGPKDNYPGG